MGGMVCALNKYFNGLRIKVGRREMIPIYLTTIAKSFICYHGRKFIGV